MTTASWKINRPNDELDELPACSSCRRRKLRCSRESPSCHHCLRLNFQCSYDSRQKPGLKPGAIEALNLRVAVLEQILLDSNGVPFVRFTPDGTIVPRESYDSANASSLEGHDSGFPPSDEVDIDIPPSAQRDKSSHLNRKCKLYRTGHTAQDLSTGVGGSLKRKADQLCLESSTHFSHNEDMTQRLPSHDILIELVDQFCLSFHHWIPYLHKARSRNEVRKPTISPKFVIVLHAIVATGLRRLSSRKTLLSDDEVDRQIEVSKMLVMKQAMSEVSVESLQALIFLVFDDLNSGRSMNAFSSIALLTRAVDFLQLTVEPGTPRSRVLMKPLALQEPAPDWTELESRRRLFWCIFLLDRYNSASTGWNTSLTSEDVHRRLPADGAYFTREVPVSCPFFGLWNRSFAKLSMSLAAHVPAQYNNEDDTPSDATMDISSPATVSSAPVDASKLGAFAYCIEATESMSQVITFFLLQRIDWQNRQDVVDWLTRFKELDLRLVHWKMFLPTRWKDSNISEDKTLVDMDPNLTLAHLTHNTSMILLHYPIAFPPVEWTNLMQLPSACSAETCHLAAVETSHIAGKFLKYTPIPFVNPQFSFCVFVAAKALLVIAQSSKQQAASEFNGLVSNLWTMSARWTCLSDSEEYRQACRRQVEVDIAGQYAKYLELLHEKCLENSDFQFDFLDHSCKNLGHSPRTPVNISTATITKQASFSASTKNSTTPQGKGTSKQKEKQTSRSKRSKPIPEIPPPSTTTMTSAQSIHGTDFVQQNAASPLQDIVLDSQDRGQGQPAPTLGVQELAGAEHVLPMTYISPRHDSLSDNGGMGVYQQHPYDHDALFRLSDTLMDEQYMQLDRVITFEGANFYVPDIGLGWQ